MLVNEVVILAICPMADLHSGASRAFCLDACIAAEPSPCLHTSMTSFNTPISVYMTEHSSVVGAKESIFDGKPALKCFMKLGTPSYPKVNWYLRISYKGSLSVLASLAADMGLIPVIMPSGRKLVASLNKCDRCSIKVGLTSFK